MCTNMHLILFETKAFFDTGTINNLLLLQLLHKIIIIIFDIAKIVKFKLWPVFTISYVIIYKKMCTVLLESETLISIFMEFPTEMWAFSMTHTVRLGPGPPCTFLTWRPDTFCGGTKNFTYLYPFWFLDYWNLY